MLSETFMAARAIGSATVSFGMVSIPIKLYSAAESAAAISFNWLHEKCGSRLKQQYVCPQDNEVVTRDQTTVLGTELALQSQLETARQLAAAAPVLQR